VNVNRAIGRLAALLVALYLVLFARQLFVQVVDGPRLAQDPHNPRLALLEQYRGRIVARDGTVLAQSGARGRVYPLGRALAQAVGYDSPVYGTSGLEAVFDQDLAARPLSNLPLAQIDELLHGAAAPAARPGATVVTTIDPTVEAALYRGLSDYPRAAGVALDPRNGEVLALASVPGFDPATIDRSFAQLLRSPSSPLLDRALDGLYPPGSTFKIVTAAAALDAGIVTLQTRFDDTGSYRVGDFLVHDNEGEATGLQDLTGAFAQSSNVDFAQVALRLGTDGWFAAADRWQLGRPIDFTLPVARDNLPDKDSVSPSILAQLGFGQADLLVTPMRMALVAATIASGGTEPRPYLVRAIRGDVERTFGPAALATPVTPASAEDVRAMMIAVVTRGTGTAAALPGIQVAGKTGTATNPAGRSHAWFVAFAPADAPRVAVAIVVENAGYGGDVAAPIAQRVIAAALGHDRS
jgi:peptidoglycan glycosyltransferase